MGNKNKLTEIEKLLLNIQWKPIIINDNLTNYEISDDGIIRNTQTNHVLALSKDEKGYLYTSLYVNGNRYGKFVHRLVAEAFIPNPENKPNINHKDFDTGNPKVGNLEWCTQKENIDYTIQMGRKPVGVDLSFTKYTEEQIHHVCQLLEKGHDTLDKISQLSGVHIGVVWDIKSQKLWKHISKNYKIPLPISNRKGEMHHSSKHTEEQIHSVCQLLIDPKTTFQEIIEKTGVGKSDINNLIQGKSWRHISEQYTIPVRERSARVTKILEWMASGLEDKTILSKLQATFDIPDQGQAKRYIRSVKKYYKPMRGSTTIDQPLSSGQ